MTPRHCRRCGEHLGVVPPTTCAACGEIHYANPKPCANAVAMVDGRVLMLLRARDPDAGTWTIPGGFCEAAEHPMLAAERELWEETGLRGHATAYLGTWMDTYGAEAPDGLPIHTAVSGYIVALEDSAATPAPAAGEALQVGWFAFDELPTPIAFPRHIPAMLDAAIAIAGGAPSQPLYDRPSG